MFSLILEKHAPDRNRHVSENFCPWFTKELKQPPVVRNRFIKKKQSVHFKSNILMEAYRKTRNKVNRLNVELERELLQAKLPRTMAILRVHGKLSIWLLIRS